MPSMAFRSVSVQIAPEAGGGSAVVAHTLLSAEDARALTGALAWQRSRDHLVAAHETADAVLAFRSLASLVDELEVVAGSEHGGPVTLRSPQVALLAEAATRYVHARDHDGHQPLEERERIARLGAMREALFDLVARLAGAEQEARSRA
jgi:hypothetical protein